jgi:hypothetical protein
MADSKEETHFAWTGQVNFNSNGNFNADNVNLANGNDNWNDNVTNATPVVACVP